MGNCGGWELPVDSRPLGRVTHCSWCVFTFLHLTQGRIREIWWFICRSNPPGKLVSYLWLWLRTTLLQMLRRVCLVHSADERFDTSYHTDVLVTPTGSCMYIPPGERSVWSLTCLQLERCLLVYHFIYKRVMACTQAINLATGESKEIVASL